MKTKNPPCGCLAGSGRTKGNSELEAILGIVCLTCKKIFYSIRFPDARNRSSIAL